MKRIESMNHTLADLMVKRHEDSNRQPTPIKSMIPEAKLPPSVEQSIYDLKRKTNEMTKAQLDRKADFESVIKAKQNEISQVSDMSAIQAKVKQTVAEISKETSEVKMDMDSIRRETSHLTSHHLPSFAPIPKVEEVSEDLIDEDELKRDLELLDCR
jgi:NurA-like 5'-3' nuclease